MHSTAARSCFSRSVLHSLLWCEPKHWGQGLLGCPGSGGESLLCGLCEGRSNPGSLTKPHSCCFFRDVDSQASRFLSLTFSPSIRRTTLGTLAMSPAPPNQRCQQLCCWFGSPLRSSKWFQIHWATLSISFMSWQGYHVITQLCCCCSISGNWLK